MMTPTLMMTLFGAGLLAATALLIAARQLRGGANSEQRAVAACRSGLSDIAERLKLGKLSESDADAERLALLLSLRPRAWALGDAVPTVPKGALIAGGVFALVLAVGVAASGDGPPAASAAMAHAGVEQDDVLSGLKGYARTIGPDGTAAPGSEGAAQLPDVNTMIDRLAARLEADPSDVNGWRLLGWSYVNTSRYTQAVAAFERAIALDPKSGELQKALAEAKEMGARGDGQTANDVSHAVPQAPGHP